MSALAATKTCTFVRGTKAIVSQKKATKAVRGTRVMAKYGEEGRLFDLSDLENTVGSWDMYGQEDEKRYNGLQSEFFERAAGGLTRREYLNALVALGGGAALLIWGAKGAKDANLPITIGPQKEAQPGPRGRL
ncbi:hypothetical protein M9434_004234 [Picochlorum sp. BPE23]|nr:hypothetical protein M9434_004234 [Picochlorum sp. BPE23]